ncbi:serine hydrolase [Micromonospora sp. WMMD1128]|uniref:serine hydrolase domain-containing protein n=1 Tax=unclassified Micromonospora TaxID=2617518 RepID=UPI00248AD612|nr:MULTISPECIES: serine hydrolase domain-containing protein [unclassified Micromonospora]WBB72559.1 serine hydrolase [Micromonospora sp. WMMD1128]WFE33980.1 serine hydrolase [Micromonospora sp. WMMD975]
MRTPTVLTAVAGLVAAAVATGLMPRAPELGPRQTGDADLAATVRAAVDDPRGWRGLAVASIESGRVRVAGLGDRAPGGPAVEPGTPFEIGSVGKPLTGMLLARRVAAGAVRPDDPLRTVLPEVTGPAGEATLAELASHRSGLPRLPTGPAALARNWWASVTAGNAYAGDDVDRVVADAAGTERDGERGTVSYSNLGPSLLGQGLAAQAGVGYPELVRRDVLGPLGMTATVVATDRGQLPAGRAEGATTGGRPTAEWLGAGYAPAGVGVWSTAEDLARLTAAMLAGTAPGADAATPRFADEGGRRIGYGWFTSRYGDREIVWHNGGTGGFRAYVGYDRTAGRGIVVLANTARDVDALGLRLLGVRGDAASESTGLPRWIGAILALAFTFLGGLSLWSTARRGPDRLTLLSAAVWAVLYLALGHRLGDWSIVPGWLWPLGAALTGVAAALAVRRWRGLPAVAGAPPWRRWTGVALSAAFATLAAVIVT